MGQGVSHIFDGIGEILERGVSVRLSLCGLETKLSGVVDFLSELTCSVRKMFNVSVLTF